MLSIATLLAYLKCVIVVAVHFHVQHNTQLHSCMVNLSMIVLVLNYMGVYTVAFLAYGNIDFHVFVGFIMVGTIKKRMAEYSSFSVICLCQELR